MTEQQMPPPSHARIWAEDTRYYGAWFDHPKDTCPVEYTRSDIAERMAEALEAIISPLGGFHCWPRVQEKARSALSAFKDSSQDRGAS